MSPCDPSIDTVSPVIGRVYVRPRRGTASPRDLRVYLNEPPELIGSLIDTLTGINQFIDTRVETTVKRLMG